MEGQITTKPVGLIIDLMIYVRGIPYIITFIVTLITTNIVLQNNVVDSNYSMLLGKPWLKDTKMAHDWGSNIVTI